MEVGAIAFERAVDRDVVQQGVLEDVLGGVGEAARLAFEHQLLGRECRQEPVERRRVDLLALERNGGGPEGAADDRSTFEHEPLLRREPVEASLQHAGDRGRRRVPLEPFRVDGPPVGAGPDGVVVDEDLDQLLDEEGVARPGCRKPFDDRCRDIGQPLQDLADEAAGGVAGKGLELDPLRPRMDRRRTSFEECGTSEADGEDRDVVASLEHQVERVQGRVVGPMQVLEEDHDRHVQGDASEERREGELRLFGADRDVVGRRRGNGRIDPDQCRHQPDVVRRRLGSEFAYASLELGRGRRRWIVGRDLEPGEEEVAQQEAGLSRMAFVGARGEEPDVVGLQPQPVLELVQQATLAETGLTDDRDRAGEPVECRFA